VENGIVACRDTISSVYRGRVAFAPKRNYFAYARVSALKAIAETRDEQRD